MRGGERGERQQRVLQDKPCGGAEGDASSTGDGANKHLAIKLYYTASLLFPFSELGIILSLPDFQILCSKAPYQILHRPSVTEVFSWLPARPSHRHEGPAEPRGGHAEQGIQHRTPTPAQGNAEEAVE